MNIVKFCELDEVKIFFFKPNEIKLILKQIFD